MSRNLGDRAAGSIIDFKFNTHSVGGAPATLAGSPTIACYKGNGTGESSVGVTLTVDFDVRTGLHNVRIDTAADAGFYSAGDGFSVVIMQGTVDGISVAGVVVAEFTLGLAAQTIAALQPLDVNVVEWLGQQPTALETSEDVAVAVWDEDLTGHTAADSAGEALAAAAQGSSMDAAGIRAAVGLASANLDTQLAGIVADTEDLQARVPAALVGGRIDARLGAVAAMSED